MNGTKNKVTKIVIAISAFIITEAATFYAYSWLFLLEGQPERHGDPRLKAWAWVCLAAMLFELFAFLYWITRIVKA